MKHTKIMFSFLSIFATGILISGLIDGKMSYAFPDMWKTSMNKNSTIGQISSIQNDEEGKPTWILSGHWFTNIINSTDLNQTDKALFTAKINMVMTDGSAMHQHKISNFTLSEMSTNDPNALSYNGSVTISMKDGPVNEVPITINILNNNVASISLDGSKIDNHFGDTPIYGTIVKMKEHEFMKDKMKMNDSSLNMSK